MYRTFGVFTGKYMIIILEPMEEEAIGPFDSHEDAEAYAIKLIDCNIKAMTEYKIVPQVMPLLT